MCEHMRAREGGREGGKDGAGKSHWSQALQGCAVGGMDHEALE